MIYDDYLSDTKEFTEKLSKGQKNGEKLDDIVGKRAKEKRKMTTTTT